MGFFIPGELSQNFNSGYERIYGTQCAGQRLYEAIGKKNGRMTIFQYGANDSRHAVDIAGRVGFAPGAKVREVTPFAVLPFPVNRSLTNS